MQLRCKMEKQILIELVGNHDVSIHSDATSVGRQMYVNLDGLDLDWDNPLNDKYKGLDDLAWELSNWINKWDAVDVLNANGFSCALKMDNQELLFDFEFNISDRCAGISMGEEITHKCLLPNLPKLINQFKEYKNLELNEEYVCCCFTYDEDIRAAEDKVVLEISDLSARDKDGRDVSFIKNSELIESLKTEILKHINDNVWLDDYETLSIEQNYENITI